MSLPMSLLPGDQLLANYSQVLRAGTTGGSQASVALMLFNSTVMALGIALGKIAISIIASFAIVYFRFPLRNFFFWMIFVTLMLPVEVRIIPTFQVASNLHLLNSYVGLTLPLIASATATFLFRQFFLTVPEELAEEQRPGQECLRLPGRHRSRDWRRAQLMWRDSANPERRLNVPRPA